tara:strand:+ start:22542 stop:23777 length:1236 start_codon:yes stop_codon:yes gene_type:complete
MTVQHSEFIVIPESDEKIDVTIVMPCLNEVETLPHCIGNALEALARLRSEYNMSGEIVIADNGSTDRSRDLATELGARVASVDRRGYGAALIGGCEVAFGRYIVMGDCDGSYDFTEGVAMIEKLEEGYDLCMGSRFKGGIARGAMPWKNRHIGNPALTGILNLFYNSGISDAHCGLRAIRKDAFNRLSLTGSGMEFASEMVIKSALLKLNVAEVPATLSADLRNRKPHLRPWRDGWRHLRYILMLSPTWLFGVPAILAMGAGILILATAVIHALNLAGPIPFGESWIVVGALLTAIGHLSGVMALASHLHGVRVGYRLPKPWLGRLRRLLSLETCVLSGLALAGLSVAGLAYAGILWRAESYTALPTILPVTLAGLAGSIGLQNILGGFLLAVIGGNEADFLPAESALPEF